MRIARTLKPHIEFDRLTTTALIAMITLNAVSILPTFMTDHVPFPASLSLGVALVLVLRFDRRFAAYYAIVATVFALATWIGRGSPLAAPSPWSPFFRSRSCRASRFWRRRGSWEVDDATW